MFPSSRAILLFSVITGPLNYVMKIHSDCPPSSFFRGVGNQTRLELFDRRLRHENAFVSKQIVDVHAFGSDHANTLKVSRRCFDGWVRLRQSRSASNQQPIRATKGLR